MVAKKKLMLLGGMRYLIPVIKCAHRLGVYVITVDYLPDNPAHKFSDEYHNISIIEKELVLNLAKELGIDGIMSFAVDPGVITAAYVAEKMRLPFQGSYNSVQILQDKSKFRDFLKANGFNVPKAIGFEDSHKAMLSVKDWGYPVIVKPVDSAGSKGVTKVDSMNDLPMAIEIALKESRKKKFIIEEFIEPIGHPSDSDCFSIDGKLVLCTFSDQYFDHDAINPFTPSAFVFPSSMKDNYQTELKAELQRLLLLLDMKTGIYNIETRVGVDKKCYIMEVSPRGGGNRLAEMVDLLYNTRLIENAVRASLSLPLLPFGELKPNGFVAEFIIHSEINGHFLNLEIHDSISQYILEQDLWIKKGDYVESFKGAHNSLGTLVLKTRYNNIQETMQDFNRLVRVNALSDNLLIPPPIKCKETSCRIGGCRERHLLEIINKAA